MATPNTRSYRHPLLRNFLALGILLSTYSYLSATTLYIGDDAAEGPAITNGANEDTVGTALTYSFVQSGTTYENHTSANQSITLQEVNFYAGSTSGTLTPVAFLYTGDQTPASIKLGSNYQVIAIGDPISVAGNSGLQNRQFLVSGAHPTVSVPSGQTLAVGYVASAGRIVRFGSGTGVIDYIKNGNSLPATLPNPLTSNDDFGLDRTLKFNVGITVPPTYIGDDAAEGNNVTNGTNQDMYTSPLTYNFAKSGTTYTNITNTPQLLYLTDVNFYTGTVTGTLTPFVSVYTGQQTATSIKTGSNYRVIQIGDPISTTGNTGLQHRQFLCGGLNSTIVLQPNETLTAGYLTTAGGVVKYGSGSGAIDYIANRDSLPASVPNPLTGDDNFGLDRTIKYNLAFSVHTALFKVACIGDSITAGTGASSSDKNYVSRLQGLLGTASYTVSNYGVSGRTMLKKGDYPYWNEKNYGDSLAALPDIVIIMLGTNDSKPQNWSYKSEFLPNYVGMVNSYRSLSSHPMIYVNTCPTVAADGRAGITNAVVSGEVVPLVRQAAAATGAWIAEVNPATANIPLDFSDHVHPNDAGHLVLANTVYDRMLETPPIYSDKTYKIVGKYSGKPIEVVGKSTDYGAKVDQSADVPNANDQSPGDYQQWTLAALTGDYFKIVNVHSGKVLDVISSSTTSGANIVQNTDNGVLSQQWQLVDQGRGYYQIMNRNSHDVLNVMDASLADRAPIQQATPVTDAAQQCFQLIEQ